MEGPNGRIICFSHAGAKHTKNEENAWKKNDPGSTDMDRSSYRPGWELTYAYMCPTKALLKMLFLSPSEVC